MFYCVSYLKLVLIGASMSLIITYLLKQFETIFARFLQWVSLKIIQRPEKMAKPFRVRFGGNTLGRQICITREGYIGWVHKLAQPSDLV